MINILIADDNLYYGKTLMDLINNSIENVRVVNIAIDGKETIDKLNNDNNIDIILLDLKMPILNGIKIINSLSNDKKQKYQNSIIVISGECDMLAKVRNENTVYDYINKMCSMSEIIEKVESLVKYKNEINNGKSLKKEIINELLELNYNLAHKGTIYLIDAIYIVYTQKMEDELNLKQNIYPILSQKYNKSIHCIKSDIVRATNYMDSNCDLITKQQYFLFHDNAKPTVKVVIYAILNRIHTKLAKK